MILEVKITPNAPQNQILRWEEGRLVIKVRGIPEKGKANAHLIAFLAKTFGIAKSRIQILTGQTARIKRLNIDGFTQEDLLKFIPS